MERRNRWKNAIGSMALLWSVELLAACQPAPKGLPKARYLGV